MSVFDIVGNVFILAGAITFVTAGLGIVRFPDVYTRASAVSTAAGLGVALVVGGSLLLQPSMSDAVKVAIIIALQLATSAIGSMTVARAAYITGVPLVRKTFNDLADTSADDRADESN